MRKVVRISALLFCFGFVLAAVREASATGEHVATIEVAAPDPAISPVFTLNATFPVPNGLVTPATLSQGGSPFGVVDANGQVVPTQIEGVARAANGAYDVVQLIARVNSRGNPAGSRDQYSVVNSVSPGPVRPNSSLTLQSAIANGPLNSVSSHVYSLTSQPGKILLRTRDVFGNVYLRDLGVGPAKVNRYGKHLVDVRTFGVMAPQTTGNNALSHMFGVHSYFTASEGESVMMLDLRVSATMDNRDPLSALDDGQKDLYFESIELLVPVGTQLVNAFPDQGFNDVPDTQGGYNVYQIVRPLGFGIMHVMPNFRHMIRRFALAPNDAAGSAKAQAMIKEQGLGFSRMGTSTTNPGAPLYSFFSEWYRGFLPQNSYIPDLSFANLTSVRNEIKNDFNTLLGQYTQYQCTLVNSKCNLPFANDWMGWVKFLGVDYGGMTSGTWISPNQGVATAASASSEGVQLAFLGYMTGSVRQQRVFDLAGEPTEIMDLAQNGSCGLYAPVAFFNSFVTTTFNPYGVNTGSNAHAQYVAANGLTPPYQAKMAKVQPNDFQHYVRVLRDINELTYLANTSIAKDEALADGNLAGFQHAILPTGCSGASPVWGSSPAPKFIPNVPHTTIYFGRGQAWWLMSLLGSYAVSNSDSKRAEIKQTFDIVVQALSQAIVPCNGAFHSVQNKNTDNNYKAAQNFEVTFVKLAMEGLAARVYALGADPVREATLDQFLTKAHRSILHWWASNWKAPYKVIPLADPADPTVIWCNKSEVPAAAQVYMAGPDSGEFMLEMAPAYERQARMRYMKAPKLKLSGKQPGPTLLAELEYFKNQPGKLIGQLNNYTAQLLACVQRGICPNP